MASAWVQVGDEPEVLASENNPSYVQNCQPLINGIRNSMRYLTAKTAVIKTSQTVGFGDVAGGIADDIHFLNTA